MVANNQAHTVVVVAQMDELFLDGVLHLLERLDGLGPRGVRLGEGVDGVSGGLSSPWM